MRSVIICFVYGVIVLVVVSLIDELTRYKNRGRETKKKEKKDETINQRN